MTFKPNSNFKYYMYWLTERQRIFWKRFRGESPPYTVDDILEHYKFTNVYRVLDRTSQHLLHRVIQNGVSYTRSDMLWRILVYKHFNLPQTWEHLCAQLGDITMKTDVNDIILVLRDLRKSGKPIYSNAYMLTASFMKNEKVKRLWRIEGIKDKHEAYLRIYQHQIIESGLYHTILGIKTFIDVVEVLRSIPTIGAFLAYQYAQDLNYSNVLSFDDNTYCSAGFGTIRGIDRVFDIEGTPDYGEIVLWTHKNFRLLLHDYGFDHLFVALPNWDPHVPDLSNCFCETDKYLRGLGITTLGKEIYGKRIKNTFIENKEPLDYIFPAKWNLKLK